VRQSSVLNDVRIQRASFAEITSAQEERRESEEAAARRRAEALARAQAEKDARRQAEAAARVREAFDAGFAKGQQAAAEKLDRLAVAFRTAYVDLRAALEAEAENKIVELAIGLAESVMRTQVQFDAAVLRAALAEVLARTPPETVLRVRVNPDDLAAARELGASLHLEQAEIAADPEIGRGGCAVHTSLGLIDSSLECRWEAARQLLLHAATPNDEH